MLLVFTLAYSFQIISSEEKPIQEIKQELVINLYEIGAIQFGDFELKSGIKSPIYIDLRRIISYPPLLKTLCLLMAEKVPSDSYDVICGVPYAALPLATALSLHQNKPMIMYRAQVKEHGLKKRFEGIYNLNEHCLIIEDVITTGNSIMDTIHAAEKEGLFVNDIVVVVDRQQGGVLHVQNKGYTIHTLFTLSDILLILRNAQSIDGRIFDTITKWLAEQHSLS